MMSSSLATLVGEALVPQPIPWAPSETRYAHETIYCNLNQHVYGVALWGQQIYKFNPIDNSCSTIDIRPIRSNLWLHGGTVDNKGCIYCKAFWTDGENTLLRMVRFGMVKIDTTNGDEVTILDAVAPFEGEQTKTGWTRGVLGLDGHIYYMPAMAEKMLKLNTEHDTFEIVGDILEGGGYSGGICGMDGCIYGMPCTTNKIVKYNPVNNVTSYVGEQPQNFLCRGKGALARNGYIYVMAYGDVWTILRINTNRHDENDTTFVALEWIECHIYEDRDWYGDAVMGLDGCIYWPPRNGYHILHHNPFNGHTSRVGHNLGILSKKYCGGALALDGVIYCMPWRAATILAIDPFREFQDTLPSHIKQHPQEKFGCLFDIDREDITYFDSVIIKYGRRGYEAMIKNLPRPDDLGFSTSNLYPYVAAALCPNSALSVVYYLLRQAPALILTTTIPCNIVGSHSDDDTPLKKKRRIHGEV